MRQNSKVRGFFFVCSSMLYEYEKKTVAYCVQTVQTVGRGPKLPFAGVQPVALSGATVCKGAADGRFVQTVKDKAKKATVFFTVCIANGKKNGTNVQTKQRRQDFADLCKIGFKLISHTL